MRFVYCDIELFKAALSNFYLESVAAGCGGIRAQCMLRCMCYSLVTDEQP